VADAQQVSSVENPASRFGPHGEDGCFPAANFPPENVNFARESAVDSGNARYQTNQSGGTMNEGAANAPLRPTEVRDSRVPRRNGGAMIRAADDNGPPEAWLSP
jgi:hypothetical protein